MGILDKEERSERREFLRRSAVGIPVVLATVRARTVLGQANQNMSAGCGSIAPGGSFCPGGGETLMKTGGEEDAYESLYKPGGEETK